MAVKIQFRRDSASDWTSANPILAEGEIGVELDTKLYKIGDGVTAWNSLGYYQLSPEITVLGLDEALAPSAPGAGTLLVYTQSRAGRLFTFQKGPSGLDTPLQPALFSNGIIAITPSGSTALTVFGTPAPTAVGTTSHPAISATAALKTSIRRAISTSAATANSACGFRIASNICFRGDIPGSGGFWLRTRWGSSSSTLLQRSMVGLFSTTGALATTQSPSALTNCVFMGNDSGDTNMQIMHNDGSGACTKIDLGSNFPAVNVDAMYDFDLFAAPNSSTIGWRVHRIDTGQTASGTISTDMPNSTQFLSWQMSLNNGGTAASVILDFFRMYLETDY